MTMITPSYLGETIEYSSLHACRSTLEDPTSADRIIAGQPAWARADLRRLVGLAGSLDAVASSAVMSEEFREDARARLMHRIGGDASTGPVALPGARLIAVPDRVTPVAPPVKRGRAGLVWRATAGGLFAAILALVATLNASASSLPGDALYSLKQVREDLGVRLAGDDQARALALLHQADTRLDETALLLNQGRTVEVAQTTQRFDEVVERATTVYVVTVDDAQDTAPAAAHIQTRLTQEQQRLQAMLQTAPEPARADLRQALVATERGRALVADPQPVEQALGRNVAQPAIAAPVPTGAPEEQPTLVATIVAPSIQAAPTQIVANELPSPRVSVPPVHQSSNDMGETDQITQDVSVTALPLQAGSTRPPRAAVVQPPPLMAHTPLPTVLVRAQPTPIVAIHEVIAAHGMDAAHGPVEQPATPVALARSVAQVETPTPTHTPVERVQPPTPDPTPKPLMHASAAVQTPSATHTPVVPQSPWDRVSQASLGAQSTPSARPSPVAAPPTVSHSSDAATTATHPEKPTKTAQAADVDRR